MGDWRRVMIEGEMDRSEVGKLRREVDYQLPPDPDQEFYCLSAPDGVCALPKWPDTVIEAVGNLAERNYGPEDVADDLEKLAEVAPSLTCRVHVGGSYEADECVATVTLEDGEATVGDPEREEIPDIPDGQMTTNFFRALT